MHRELQSASPTWIVFIDWGIDVQLRYLSRHTLPAQAAIFSWDWNDKTVSRLETELEEGEVLFVSFANPADRAFPASYAAAGEILHDLGFRLRVRKSIEDRQHLQIYHISVAKPLATAGIP